MSGWSGGFEDATGAIPGDPAQLRAVGRNYSVMADELERQGDALRRQVIANWEGEAAAGWDSYRQRASRNYLEAAQTARDSAAVVTTRAQSIEDNRRVAADATRIKDNATRASQDTPRDSPAWQNNQGELRQAEAQLASAQAADEQSAADTTTQASTLHQQLPATRLLADSSPVGAFDIVAPAAAPVPAVPPVAPLIAPPGMSGPEAGPELAPRAVPQPRTAPPPPDRAGGGKAGGGGTRGGTGGGASGASGGGDGGRSRPPSGGSADNNGGGSGGSAPGWGPDLGDVSPPTNPAEAAPSEPSLGGRTPSGVTTPAAGTPSLRTPELGTPSVFGAGAGAYPAGGYGGATAAGTGVLPWSSGGYAPRRVLGQSGYISQELGGPRGWSPVTGLEAPVGSGPAGSAGSGVLPPVDSPAAPPAQAPVRVPDPGASPRSPTNPGGGQGSPVTSDPPPVGATGVRARVGRSERTGRRIGRWAQPAHGAPGQRHDRDRPGRPPVDPPDQVVRPTPLAGRAPGPGPRRAPSRTPQGRTTRARRARVPRPGISGLPSPLGTVLVAGTAAGLVHAHRKVEAKQRRDYRAGSGRRDVLPTPPAVRAMVRAHHTNPHRDDLDQLGYGPHRRDPHSHIEPPTDDPAMPTAAGAGGPRRPGLVGAVLPLGMREGSPVMLDLGVGTVAFSGLGAGDAVRSLITSTVGGIRGGTESSTAPGRCILGVVEAGELFGSDHGPLPAGIIITDGLTASLAAATALAARLSPDWEHGASDGSGQPGGDGATAALTVG